MIFDVPVSVSMNILVEFVNIASVNVPSIATHTLPAEKLVSI